MVRSGYIITVSNVEPVSGDAYQEWGGHVVDAMKTTIGSLDKLHAILHVEEYESAAVEVEVRQLSETQVQASAMLELEGSTRAGFDKNMFSSMMKELLPMPVKITKRALTRDELL